MYHSTRTCPFCAEQMGVESADEDRTMAVCSCNARIILESGAVVTEPTPSSVAELALTMLGHSHEFGRPAQQRRERRMLLLAGLPAFRLVCPNGDIAFEGRRIKASQGKKLQSFNRSLAAWEDCE